MEHETRDVTHDDIQAAMIEELKVLRRGMEQIAAVGKPVASIVKAIWAGIAGLVIIVATATMTYAGVIGRIDSLDHYGSQATQKLKSDQEKMALILERCVATQDQLERRLTDLERQSHAKP